MNASAEDIARALGGAKKAGRGWNCQCPVHDDAKASLNVADGDDGKVLARCYAGCSQTQVLDALRARGLVNGFDGGAFDFTITALGKPVNVWTYFDSSGTRELLRVARYATPTGKEYRPWIPDGARWKCAAHPVPRPLYGLELLARHTALPVLVTEGEKACDAARELVGNRYVTTTWPCGAGAADKVDWTPLQGRSVVLWPDADKPGVDAMRTVASKLANIASKVVVVEIDDRPNGWDIADAKSERWTGGDVLTYIDEHAKQIDVTAAEIVEIADKRETHGEKVENKWPQPLDFEALAQRGPQAPQFIIRDWLPAGYATLFAGHGGIGKSALALLLAVCIALGIAFFGIATERRRVLYLSCEDREGVLHWRLHHICAFLGIDMKDLAGWLDVLDLVGRDTVLWLQDPRMGYTVTPAFAELTERVTRQRTQVLMVDGISDAFGGNENARPEVKRFVNALLALIPLDGALLLLGHVAKPAATNSATSEGYSGSTQWHNAVRARWYLYPETQLDDDGGPAQRTGKLTLELQKSNLGRTDQSVTFQWDDEAHMFVAIGTFGTSAIDRKHRDETEQMGILHALAGCANAQIIVPAATQGRRTAFNVLSLRPEFPASLRSAKGRFWGQIEGLRQLRQIDESEYRRANRHHGSQFVVTAEGMRRCVD